MGYATIFQVTEHEEVVKNSVLYTTLYIDIYIQRLRFRAQEVSKCKHFLVHLHQTIFTKICPNLMAIHLNKSLKSAKK